MVQQKSHGTPLRFIIWLILSALIGFLFVSCESVPFKGDQILKHRLINFAKRADTNPFTNDIVLADSMAKAAKEAGFPELNKYYFLTHIKREQSVIRVKIHYERDYFLRGENKPAFHHVVDYEITEKIKGP